MNESERYEALRHCRYVDEIIKDAPWVIDIEFLAKHKVIFMCALSFLYSPQLLYFDLQSTLILTEPHSFKIIMLFAKNSSRIQSKYAQREGCPKGLYQEGNS